MTQARESRPGGGTRTAEISRGDKQSITADTDDTTASALVTGVHVVGKALVRQRGNGRLSALITETEAYEGVHDLASHSARG